MLSGIRKTKGFKWVKLLLDKNIYTFKFNELPESLRDKAAFRRASADKLIIERKKERNGVKEWELSTALHNF